MLVGMLYLGYVYFQTTGNWSFSLQDWNMMILPFDMQFWLFIAFFCGFAIKVPMFPFHTWLPYAHGQAPNNRFGITSRSSIENGNIWVCKIFFTFIS